MTGDAPPPEGASDVPVVEATRVALPHSPQVTLVRATTRTFPIPSCSLSGDDLHDLRLILLRQAQDSARLQVQSLTRTSGKSEEEFARLCEYVQGLLELTIAVHSADGEWMGGSGTDVLAARPSALNVTRIDFDSAFYHRNQTGQAPLNSFTVSLDFRRTRVMDGLVGSGEELNESVVNVHGQDATWANGVAAELRDFFKRRATRRNWLYHPHCYGVASLIGLPLSFYWVYRIDHWFSPTTHTLPQPLVVAIYVYVVLVFMFVFRITFNLARSAFPKVEGPERERRAAWHQRGLFGALAFALFSTLLIDLLKAVWRLTMRRG